MSIIKFPTKKDTVFSALKEAIDSDFEDFVLIGTTVDRKTVLLSTLTMTADIAHSLNRALHSLYTTTDD